MKIILRKFKNYIFLVLFLFVSIGGHAQFGPNCPTLCFGPGGAFTSGTLIVTANTFYSSVTIKNGQTLTVKSGFTLYVGQLGTSADSQVVDFQNGSTVVIEAGASLVVNGKLNNSNNSDSVTVNGSISVTGNVTVGNGSIIGGTGSLVSTGTVSGPGIILGQTGDCYQASGKPIISSTPPTCSTPGSSQISNYNSSYTYAFTPTGPTVIGGLISGMTIGTSYRVTGKSVSCTISPSSDAFSNAAMLPTPATPTIVASASTAICTGGSVTLTSSAATSYLWSTGATTQSITVSTAGSYTVKVKNATGCESLSSAATVVTVNALPNNVISTGFTAGIICVGGSPVLTYDADDTTFSSPYTITYRNNSTLVPFTVTIPTAAAFNFTPGDNPTSNAGYTLISISNATCTRTTGIANTGANLVVRPFPTSTISGATTVCQGGASPNITFTNPQTAAIIVTYNVNGGTSTSIEIVAGSALVPAIATVAVPTSSAGSYIYNLTKVEYKTLSTCSSTIAGVSAVVTVNTTTSPMLGILTQPDCVTATGTFKILNYNSSLLYSFTPSTGISRSGDLVTASPGSYTVTASSGTCLSGPSSTVVINPVVTNKWTGSWSTGANPVATEKIEFAGNYSAITDLVGCSCEVLSGNVTFLSGTKLTLINDLKVTGGNLTFEDSASLVQINTVANSGDINYKRTTQSAVSNFDYTYWSSPVSPQTLFNVSPLTLGDKYFSFNGATDSWVQESPSAVMAKGIGYIIRGPQPTTSGIIPPDFYQATFKGVPHNGTITIPIGATVEASYLLGNPYPSALDANTFITNNSILDGTLYFWTHGTAVGAGTSNLGSGLYAYTSDDYASYNLTGGAAAGFGGVIPTGKIGSGQGFFVTTIGPGAVNFTNSMRVGVGGIIGGNTQFFKTQASSKTSATEKNRLWLDFYSSTGAFKQALVGYVSGATNDIDMQYDGESFDANEYVDFYSIINNKNFVIQGRALPFEHTDQVQLGFKTTIAGEFKIKIKQFDGLFETQDVFIEDKLLKTIHDLKKDEYVFTTEMGTFNDRFVLLYSTSKAISATTKLAADEKIVLVSTTEKEIKLVSPDSILNAVFLYDAGGKQVYNNRKINGAELSIRNLRKGNTVYIIKIKLNNGQTLTQKVIY